MWRTGFLVVASTVALVGVGLLALPQGQAQSSAVASEARRALAQARAEAARARERAAAFDRQASSALLAGDRAALAAAALAARVQQAEAVLASAQADLALIIEARRALDTRLARESAPVARLLAGLQTQVRRPAVLQLLQPGSITDAVHLRAVVASVEPQIRDRTAALRERLSRARKLERDAARLAAQRRTWQSELIARRGELAALAAAERLKARGASLSADREAERAFAIGARTRDLNTLVSRVEADQASSERLARAPARPGSSAAAPLTEPHRRPVQGRPAAVQPSQRKGLTLEPRPGAVVIAPGPGRVAFAGPYRGFGSIVILEHEDGWTSLLTGLAVSQVAAGQKVVAGSPLGQAGVREPRITIELRRGGVPVDAAGQLR